MVEGKKRSRSMRRVKVVTPGHRVVIHYESRKPQQARCEHGHLLHGIPRGTVSDISRLAKSQKRPERRYGGVLCSACARKKLIERVRVTS